MWYDVSRTNPHVRHTSAWQSRVELLPVEPPQMTVCPPGARRDHELLLRHHACQALEVWTESRSMAGVIQDVIDAVGVPLYAAGGFTSLTLAYNAAEHIRAQSAGRPVRIVYVGDWDPAGVLIDETILKELRTHLPGLDIKERRLAITEKQAARLPSKPRKSGEKRRPDIEATVEAEALPAGELRALLRRTVEDYLPPRALEVTKLVEAQEQRSIFSMAEEVRRLGVQGALVWRLANL